MPLLSGPQVTVVVDFLNKALDKLILPVSSTFWVLLIVLSALVFVPFAAARANRDFSKGVILAIFTVFYSSMIVFGTLMPLLGGHLFWSEVWRRGKVGVNGGVRGPEAGQGQDRLAAANAGVAVGDRLEQVCRADAAWMSPSALPPGCAGLLLGRVCLHCRQHPGRHASVCALRARRLSPRLRRALPRRRHPNLAVRAGAVSLVCVVGCQHPALTFKRQLPLLEMYVMTDRCMPNSLAPPLQAWHPGRLSTLSAGGCASGPPWAAGD